MKRILGSSFSRRSAACLAGYLLAAGPLAVGEIQDTVGFDVPGIIIIWAADGNGNAPIVSDFIIDNGTNDIDLIAGDVHTVVTGTLTASPGVGDPPSGAPLRIQNAQGLDDFTVAGGGALDASDTFSAFTLNDATDINTRGAFVRSSFYIASNTDFDISATATPLGATSARDFNNIFLLVRVAVSGRDDGFAFGSSARNPAIGGGTGGVAGQRLSGLATGGRVFEGVRSTAVLPGTIAQQSVRIDLRYRFASGNIDLSNGVIDAGATVVYTAFVP